MQHIKKFVLLTMLAMTQTVNADSVKTVFPDSHSLKWQAVPDAKTLQYAVLAGDPSKAEFYVVRLKIPANYHDLPHQHFYDKYDTVISGTYYLGVGSKFNPENAIGLPAGSFFKVPANVDHYGFTKEETVLQISGVGPWSSVEKTKA